MTKLISDKIDLRDKERCIVINWLINQDLKFINIYAPDNRATE